MPTRLDRGDRHQRLRQPAIELAVPLRVAAEARRHAGGDHFEGAAAGVARLTRGVDLGDHPRFDLRDPRSATARRRAAPPLRRT